MRTRKVVTGFITPDNQRWQGACVIVCDDGSWWRWDGEKWIIDCNALVVPDER